MISLALHGHQTGLKSPYRRLQAAHFTSPAIYHAAAAAAAATAVGSSLVPQACRSRRGSKAASRAAVVLASDR